MSRVLIEGESHPCWCEEDCLVTKKMFSEGDTIASSKYIVEYRCPTCECNWSQIFKLDRAASMLIIFDEPQEVVG